MSFRSNRTIAGPGVVIEPLPRPNRNGRTTGKTAKGPEKIFSSFLMYVFSVQSDHCRTGTGNWTPVRAK